MMDDNSHIEYEDGHQSGDFNMVQMGMGDQGYTNAIVTPGHPGITVVGTNLTPNRSASHSSSFAQRQVHQCTVCQKIFVSFKGLQQHAVIHTDQKPFACDICGKAFRFKSNLFEHKSVHSGHISYSCTFCGKTCRLKGNLKKHLKTHVASKEELDEAWKPFARRCSNRKPTNEIPDDAIVVRSAGEPYYATPSRPSRKKKYGLGDNSTLWVAKLKRGEFMPVVPIHDKLLRLRDILRQAEQNFFPLEEALDVIRAAPFESFECPFCKNQFASALEADEHMQMEHSQHNRSPMYCQTCLVFFNDAKRYEQHRDHHKRVQQMLGDGSLSATEPEIQDPETFFMYSQSAAPLLDDTDVDIDAAN